VSKLFEYNYRNNGNPANHNWAEFYPTERHPPVHQFPVVLPYPSPEWAERPPEVIPLTIPYPKHTVAPQAPPEPSDIKVKLEAPLQVIDKRDPYEQEDTAMQFLSSVLQGGALKHEEDVKEREDKGEEQLLAAFSQLPQRYLLNVGPTATTSAPVVVKHEESEVELGQLPVKRPKDEPQDDDKVVLKRPKIEADTPSSLKTED
jgi:hypothetical protein